MLLVSFSLLPFIALGSVKVKSVMKEGVFSPYAKVSYSGKQSSLHRNFYNIKSGEEITVLEREPNGRCFKVELGDGSVGYMPIVLFAGKNIIVTLPEGKYLTSTASSYESLQKEMMFGTTTNGGKYRIVAFHDWTYGRDGLLDCKIIEAISQKNGKKVFIDNTENRVSILSLIKSSDILSSKLNELPVGRGEHKKIFLAKGGEKTLSKYVGLNTSELWRLIGEPDAVITKSRSRNGLREYYYGNICYKNKQTNKSLVCGALFFLNDDFIVTKAMEEGHSSVSKERISYVSLPKLSALNGSNKTSFLDKLSSSHSSSSSQSRLVQYDFDSWGLIPLLLATFFLSVLFCLIEELKIRVGLKIGDNVVAKWSSAIIPVVVVMAILFAVYARNGSHNLILWITVFVTVYYFHRKFITPMIETYRCPVCHKYVSRSSASYGEDYVTKEIRKEYSDERNDYDYTPDAYDPRILIEKRTRSKLVEEKEYTLTKRPRTDSRVCPKCGYNWSTQEDTIIHSESRLLKRYRQTLETEELSMVTFLRHCDNPTYDGEIITLTGTFSKDGSFWARGEDVLYATGYGRYRSHNQDRDDYYTIIQARLE